MIAPVLTFGGQGSATSIGSSAGQVHQLFLEVQVGTETLISNADRAEHAAGSGSESVQVVIGC